MIISLWGYAIQIASFYLAVIYPAHAWPLAITGAVYSGFTSAVWWTSQGVCFEYTCIEIEKIYKMNADDNLIDEEKLYIKQTRRDLSASWTIIYQGK